MAVDPMPAGFLLLDHRPFWEVPASEVVPLPFPLAGLAAGLPPCPYPLGPSSEANLPTTARHLLAALASPFSFSLRQRGWPWTFQWTLACAVQAALRQRRIPADLKSEFQLVQEFYLSIGYRQQANVYDLRYQRRRVPRRRPRQSRPERQLVDLGGVSRSPTRLPLGGGGVSYLEATAAV
jgi:hypothetical protein